MKADEGPAYGVALLAAVGAGEFKDIVEACDATVKTTSETKTNAAATKAIRRSLPGLPAALPLASRRFSSNCETGLSPAACTAAQPLPSAQATNPLRTRIFCVRRLNAKWRASLRSRSRGRVTSSPHYRSPTLFLLAEVE